MPESDRITRRCSNVSENLTNKETDRIHMVSRKQAAGRDGESLRGSQPFLQAKPPPPKKTNKQNVFRSEDLFFSASH